MTLQAIPEWIDLGCFRIKRICIDELTAKLAEVEGSRGDGLTLRPVAPGAIYIGDQDIPSSYPAIEIKVPTSFRGDPNASADLYTHRVSVVLSETDTSPLNLELKIQRYGLALLLLLNRRRLTPDMKAELIAGNIFYTLLDRLGHNKPFVRAVGVEFTAESITQGS